MHFILRFSAKPLLGLLLFLASNSILIAEPAPKISRVGGDYLVTAIEHLDKEEFRIQFSAVTPTGKFDQLTLHSNHVHVAVKQGQKLRLSAEILADSGATAEVAQMVIFVVNPQGPIPVWLLSNRAGPRELNATKYLEMHSPLTDYIIM